MKKLVIVLVVLMFVVPSTLFAGSFLGLKVGPAAILNAPINLETIDETFFDEIGVEDFYLGVDTRFNVSVLEVAALVQGAYIPEFETLLFDGHFGVGVSLELLGLVDLGVTFGPMLSGAANAVGAIIGYVDEFNDFVEVDGSNYGMLPVIARGTVDVNLGGISVGAFALINSGVTIGDLEAGVLPDAEAVDTTATVGVSVLLSIL